MEKDLGLGDSMITLESFMTGGSYQIPTEGLIAVYLECERRSARHGFVVVYYYELEFCYEDGTHFSVKELSWKEKDFRQLIRRYDDSVNIYIHQKMKESVPLLCPVQRLNAEEPFVKQEVMEELTTLCNGNSFWRLDVKSRNKYNGNKEVEMILHGTTLTWLIWLAWLCLSVYLFFYFYIQSKSAVLHGLLLGAGVFYYLFFIRSARKITEKAKTIFNEAIFCGK